MPPMEYFNMIQAKDEGFRFGVRRRLVMDALELGNKPAARLHKTTVKTVRLWAGRYHMDGLPGLEERSRAPKCIPHKTNAEVAERVVAQKKLLKGFGVGRMVNEFELGCGKGAALRICREAGVIHKRKNKRARRNDLRAM